MLAGGGILYGAGVALTAWAPSPLWLNLSAGVLMGLGMAAASFYLVLAALGRRVPPEQRTVLFGVATAAGSMGQFLFAPLGQTLIQNFGWAEALVILGAVMLAIPLLAMAFAGPSGSAGEVVREQSLGQALAEAFGHKSYLLLTAGFFVCGFQIGFIGTHLPSYILDRGLSPSVGAWALALIGLFNVIGSLASGWIGQHYSKRVFLALIYLARAAAFAIFVLLPTTPLGVLIFAATLGLLWLSTVAPTSGLVAVMFGPKYMATLTGFVFLSHQVGAFLGVWLGGRLFDQTGSYNVVWWLAVALGVFAAIVHWPIREAPVDARQLQPA